ncbi:coiled-coil domain-containing protein 112 isoform X2 [Paramormyrops kingsleyae]|uniref:coiled-coil domain-containing protein 112 isoform X2 n=1 Tax=Paramormyrops kingsleyae TaxID=1676925 RepID=UPI000CD604E0|nr:coiled-coil domain-containing protein 112 isoform X1 [Paramormyrops kingsleyae]
MGGINKVLFKSNCHGNSVVGGMLPACVLQMEDTFLAAETNDKFNRKEKVASEKKAEFLRNAEKFRKQINVLEKEKRQSIQSKRSAFRGGFEELEELGRRLQEDRKAEVKKLQQRLAKICNGVSRFRGQLADVKPTAQVLEKLNELMTEVESSIGTLKEEQCRGYEELCKAERICWLEICALEKKIEAWTLGVAAGPQDPPPSAKVRLVQALEDDLPPEVVELEIFLQRTGGRLGGWDQYDHHTFLKVWTKYSGRPAYRKEALLYLPGKAEEEMQQHEDWYQKLLSLQEKKKEAILRWKAKRQQEKEAQCQQQVKEEDATRQKKAGLEEAHRCRLEEERQEAAVHLEAWRTQRGLQEAKENQRKLQEEVLQRRQEKEERRKQIEVKMMVEAYIQQRKEQEELLVHEKEAQEHAEMEERRRCAARGIKQFQERDLQKLETKLQERQAKEDEEAERGRRLARLKEKVEGHVIHDPERISKSTKVWEERTKHVGPSGGGRVFHVFHRAVPAWRQDL